MGNTMAERGGGEKSLDPRQIVPYHAAITYLATIRGRYVPVWAMAGTGTRPISTRSIVVAIRYRGTVYLRCVNEDFFGPLISESRTGELQLDSDESVKLPSRYQICRSISHNLFQT